MIAGWGEGDGNGGACPHSLPRASAASGCPSSAVVLRYLSIRFARGLWLPRRSGEMTVVRTVMVVVVAIGLLAPLANAELSHAEAPATSLSVAAAAPSPPAIQPRRRLWRPRTLPYVDGQTIPDGYVKDERPFRELAVAGALTLGVPGWFRWCSAPCRARRCPCRSSTWHSLLGRRAHLRSDRCAAGLS